METSWIFVYGTLMSGGCRATCWPCKPLEIWPAWTLGSLYRGPSYPAMRPGEDRVRGEAVCVHPSALSLTLKTLDAIEGTYADSRLNLYDRVRTIIHRPDHANPIDGWTYHYAVDPKIDGFTRIEAVGGYAAWIK